MRSVLRQMKRLEHEYPRVKQELKSVSHMHELGDMEPSIHKLCNEQCMEITENLAKMDLTDSSSLPTMEEEENSNTIIPFLDSHSQRSKHLVVLESCQKDIENTRANQGIKHLLFVCLFAVI